MGEGEGLGIDSSRYSLAGVIGRGTWGEVYAAEDVWTGDRVAIKVLSPGELAREQMIHRQLSPVEVMRRESGLRASRNVLPRVYDVDTNGKPFLVMPICPGTLVEVLAEGKPLGNRNSIRLGYPNKEWGFQILRDLVNGLGEMHSLYGRAHGDWKPENVMMDRGRRAILNDLGTATCLSLGQRSDSPRDNMGHIQTRAPELFLEREATHPNISSDVYGCGALCFRVHTGEYPLEREFAPLIAEGGSEGAIVGRINNFFNETKEGALESILWGRIKKLVPKEFQDFYYASLRFKPGKRYGGADIMARDLESAIGKTTMDYKMRRVLRDQGVGLLVGLFVLGTVAIGGFLRKYNTNLPPKPALHGPLYSDKSGGVMAEFESESSLDLPTCDGVDKKIVFTSERISADKTRDNTTAYLLAQYDLASQQLELGQEGGEFYNDSQRDVWQRSSLSPSDDMRDFDRKYLIVAKNIELAIHKAKLPNGNIDLEDLCAIARVGEDRVRMAQRASGSFNFKEYLEARDSGGEYIIPKEEVPLIKTWIAYVHKNQAKSAD